MKDAKVQIEHNGIRVTKFSINETDLTSAPITAINIKIQGCWEKPKVIVEFDADEIKINGDFEILKKIQQEKCIEHKTEFVINGATDVKAKDLAKAIMKNFNKSSCR